MDPDPNASSTEKLPPPLSSLVDSTQHEEWMNIKDGLYQILDTKLRGTEECNFMDQVISACNISGKNGSEAFANVAYISLKTLEAWKPEKWEEYFPGVYPRLKDKLLGDEVHLIHITTEPQVLLKYHLSPDKLQQLLNDFQDHAKMDPLYQPYYFEDDAKAHRALLDSIHTFFDQDFGSKIRQFTVLSQASRSGKTKFFYAKCKDSSNFLPVYVHADRMFDWIFSHLRTRYNKVKESCAQQPANSTQTDTDAEKINLSSTCHWMIEVYIFISMHVASKLCSFVKDKRKCDASLFILYYFKKGRFDIDSFIRNPTALNAKQVAKWKEMPQKQSIIMFDEFSTHYNEMRGVIQHRTDKYGDALKRMCDEMLNEKLPSQETTSLHAAVLNSVEKLTETHQIFFAGTRYIDFQNIMEEMTHRSRGIIDMKKVSNLPMLRDVDDVITYLKLAIPMVPITNHDSLRYWTGRVGILSDMIKMYQEQSSDMSIEGFLASPDARQKEIESLAKMLRIRLNSWSKDPEQRDKITLLCTLLLEGNTSHHKYVQQQSMLSVDALVDLGLGIEFKNKCKMDDVAIISALAKVFAENRDQILRSLTEDFLENVGSIGENLYFALLISQKPRPFAEVASYFHTVILPDEFRKLDVSVELMGNHTLWSGDEKKGGKKDLTVDFVMTMLRGDCGLHYKFALRSGIGVSDTASSDLHQFIESNDDNVYYVSHEVKSGQPGPTTFDNKLLEIIQQKFHPQCLFRDCRQDIQDRFRKQLKEDEHTKAVFTKRYIRVLVLLQVVPSDTFVNLLESYNARNPETPIIILAGYNGFNIEKNKQGHSMDESLLRIDLNEDVMNDTFQSPERNEEEEENLPGQFTRSTPLKYRTPKRKRTQSITSSSSRKRFSR